MYRYIGNKTKLADEILKIVKKVIGDTGVVADIMCGTGSVSLELRKQGYKVIASDVMTYSKYHSIVNLLIDRAPSFDMLAKELDFINVTGSSLRYERVLDYLNSLEPINGYFYNEFSPDGRPLNGTDPRKYFTSHNACKIDAIRLELNKWEERQIITNKEISLLRHNLIMGSNEVANISGTYGYFLSSFTKSSCDNLTLKPSAFYSQYSTDHVVLQGYAEDISSQITADLCYIDPPYIKRQYAANYHILETIARGDEPIAAGKSGLRPWRDQYSNFCSKVRVKNAFRQIISNMRCPNFLISYNEDGLLQIDELLNLFREFGEVELYELDYKRFRSNQSNLSHKVTEYVIYLRKHSR